MVSEFENDWIIASIKHKDEPLFVKWKIKSIIIYESKRGIKARIVFEKR